MNTSVPHNDRPGVEYCLATVVSSTVLDTIPGNAWTECAVTDEALHRSILGEQETRHMVEARLRAMLVDKFLPADRYSDLTRFSEAALQVRYEWRRSTWPSTRK